MGKGQVTKAAKAEASRETALIQQTTVAETQEKLRALCQIKGWMAARGWAEEMEFADAQCRLSDHIANVLEAEGAGVAAAPVNGKAQAEPAQAGAMHLQATVDDEGDRAVVSLTDGRNVYSSITLSANAIGALQHAIGCDMLEGLDDVDAEDQRVDPVAYDQARAASLAAADAAWELAKNCLRACLPVGFAKTATAGKGGSNG